MNTVKVRIVNKSGYELPTYKYPGDSGMDIHAVLHEPTVVAPGQRILIKTGLYFEIPAGYEIQVRPRSGLAIKEGITVLNSPGTIDSNYYDELGIIVINHGDTEFTVSPGDRIAQIVLAEVPVIEWDPVEETNGINNRGGGFGHSGIK